MSREKKKRAARGEKLTIGRLAIANAFAFAALMLAALITLGALGLLPSIFTFFF